MKTQRDNHIKHDPRRKPLIEPLCTIPVSLTRATAISGIEIMATINVKMANVPKINMGIIGFGLFCECS